MYTQTTALMRSKLLSPLDDGGPLWRGNSLSSTAVGLHETVELFVGAKVGISEGEGICEMELLWDGLSLTEFEGSVDIEGDVEGVSSCNELLPISLGALVVNVISEVGLGLKDGLRATAALGVDDGSDVSSFDVKVGLNEGAPVTWATLGSNVDKEEGITVGTEDALGATEGDLEGALDSDGDKLGSIEGSLECTAEGSPLGEPDCDGSIDTVGSNDTEGTLDIEG